MKALNVLLSIAISVLIAVGVFEGGLRLIGLGPPNVLNQFDAKLGWSKQPSRSVHRSSSEFDVTFDINELGLRDDPMSSPAKPAGTFRVVCLGDSFTLGYTVERHDLFVDQLEHWWQSEGRKVDVINTGTEGYSTDQEAAWLLEHGDAFAPDLVLLFPYENDIYWNGQETYTRFPKPRFSAMGELETGDLADPGERTFMERYAVTRLFHKASNEGMAFTPAGASRPILREFAPLLTSEPDFVADAVARTQGALIALKQKCDALGAKLVVAPIPSHSAIDPEYARGKFDQILGLDASAWSPDKPVQIMLDAARAAGIDTLDAREHLKAAFASEGDLYFSIDWHLNPAGNRAFSQFLHKSLDELGAFPASVAATTTGSLPEPPAASEGLPTWSYWFGALWLVLGISFGLFYKDENSVVAFIKVGLLLGAIFTIAVGGSHLLTFVPPKIAQLVLLLFVFALFGFILYKLGRRLATILELLKAFVLRGHWYLMPLVVVLLTIGSLLVVAASSPLVAPFIYTLF